MTQPHSDLGCDWPTKGRGSPSGACVLPHTGVTQTFSVMITSWPRPFKMTSRGDVCGGGWSWGRGGASLCKHAAGGKAPSHMCLSVGPLSAGQLQRFKGALAGPSRPIGWRYRVFIFRSRGPLPHPQPLNPAADFQPR